MNKDIKKKWVDALRSGEYAQGRGQLKDITEDNYNGGEYNNYCCLGVLCVIAERDKVGSFDGESYVCDIDDWSDSELPRAVVEWADLEGQVPKCMYDGKHTNLVSLNDDDELDFKEIARVIDEQF